jgi:putative transposase
VKKARFTASQIMVPLKSVDAGLPAPEICRVLGISTATFYKWCSKFGGMGELEDENRRLTKVNLDGRRKAEIANEYLAKK